MYTSLSNLLYYIIFMYTSLSNLLSIAGDPSKNRPLLGDRVQIVTIPSISVAVLCPNSPYISKVFCGVISLQINGNLK